MITVAHDPVFVRSGVETRVHTRAIRCTPVWCHDVAPDGERFWAVQARTPVTHINLIQNWVEELKAKVPPGR